LGKEFLGRLGRVLKETQSVCYAWSLNPTLSRWSFYFFLAARIFAVET